ncbi:caspase family protein [Novosphingobium hassiacum]|uniref:caspase family protein n=1 Tax=Novosphingobium hassiacum TaxID=173676 RepID=UPI0031B5BB5E
MISTKARIAVRLLIGFFMISVPVAAHAEVRALLVGVSQFSSPVISDLEGPANDLSSMEDLARKEGASDVTVLRDGNVTRTTVETALHALGLRSRPGDWILFYYSGHGAQAEAKVKGTRDGDFDQFLPLAGFDPENQDPERFIVDKDIYGWLSRYVLPDVQILMIADTCHSGTLHRSVDTRSYRFTPRLALRAVSSQLQLVSRPGPKFPAVLNYQDRNTLPGDAAEREDLSNLIYIAASQDEELAQEMPMPTEEGPSRGLLTYAFEQGLTERGADGKTLLADLDADGSVSAAEISIYVDGQVRTLTGQRQRPKTSYVNGKEVTRLFASSNVQATRPVSTPLPGIFAQDRRATAMLSSPAATWKVMDSAQDADFVWDYAAGALIRRSGDVVASQVNSTAKLIGVFDKWSALENLRPMINEARAQLAISPLRDGARYVAGTSVKIRLRSSATLKQGAYATVFNVASDGTVQRIFPVDEADGKGQLQSDGVLLLIEAQVVEPFGVDHVVAVVSEAEQTEFRLFLQTLEGQRSFGKVVEPIKRILAAAPGRSSVSIAEIYTGDRP